MQKNGFHRLSLAFFFFFLSMPRRETKPSESTQDHQDELQQPLQSCTAMPGYLSTPIQPRVRCLLLSSAFGAKEDRNEQASNAEKKVSRRRAAPGRHRRTDSLWRPLLYSWCSSPPTAWHCHFKQTPFNPSQSGFAQAQFLFFLFV